MLPDVASPVVFTVVAIVVVVVEVQPLLHAWGTLSFNGGKFFVVRIRLYKMIITSTPTKIHGTHFLYWYRPL